MRPLFAALILLPFAAHAEGWSPDACGAPPVQPRYDLSSRAAYNAAIRQANAYQRTASAYATCVLQAAHAEQTRISREAQDRIADIQAVAVGKQQDVYARLQTQAAAFKAAAARLAAKP